MKSPRFVILIFALVGVGCSTDDANNPGGSGGGSGPVGGTSGTGGSTATGGSVTGGTGGTAGSAGAGATSGSAGSAATAGSTGTGGSAGASTCAPAGADAVTTLCGDRQLDALTEAEATSLCTDTAAYVSRALSRANACKYYALVSSASSSAPTEMELQATCSASETACNQPGSTMGTGMNTLCTEIPDTCPATVAEYSACVKDETMLFDQGVNGLPACATLTFATVGNSFDLPTTAGQAASCMTLTTKCPGFSAPYIN